ncbi:MAG: glycosyltransferase family 4 protein [Lewinellaceae bacterium]|nr:glycosyltransferase family 4 protein [Saprospiraceae bacterium]MCB9342211.1 glycosyltransferase family 4 protein [Lewinellaceae bacterium]
MYLHIVAFDIPYPANYGGVIVIYNQIKALHAQGVKVILHCFQYGDRKPAPELANYCHEVYYYKRSRAWIWQLSFLPFIMQTRLNRSLYRRLKKDNHPILFEGMHTAGFVWKKRLRARQKLVRMHNIEWQYYESLSQVTPGTEPLKKAYYFIESIRLQRTEPWVVLHADEIITLSKNDAAYFRNLKANTHYIPAFHPNKVIESQPGKGEYVLFHGKLSVPDNERSAIWLMEEVFADDLEIPLFIAGLEPTERLREIASRYDYVTLIENPDDKEMNRLITQAHINLLVSTQSAGVKLKLINALYRGRFCIVNEAMVSGSDLSQLCYVRNSAAAIRQAVEALINAPFEQKKIEERRALLETAYSNEENAKKLISLIKFDQEKAE